MEAKKKCIGTSSSQPELYKPISDGERAFFQKYFQNEDFWMENDELETTTATNKNAICVFRISGDILLFGLTNLNSF